MSKDGMNYETTSIKKPTAKQVLLKEIDHLGTPSIILFLVRRHKVGLLVTSNIILFALYICPPLPSMLFGLL